jgi:hypothetical protein
MNCCIACGGPITPPKSVMRKDKVGSRSLLYLEEQVIRDGNEWGLAPNSEVRLLADEEMLHTVHQTNSMPVLLSLFGLQMWDLWAGEDTPDYAVANAGIPLNTPLNALWIWIGCPDGARGRKFRAVFWTRPRPIALFASLRNCMRNCLARINNMVRVAPNIGLVTRGCAECNSIMTQEATMRHLLARAVIHPRPLVPLNSIIRYDLAGGDPRTGVGAIHIASAAVLDPNLGNVDGLGLSFQATIAYYIHRCLPTRPPPGTAAALQHERNAREFDIMFAFCLLNILCLLYERYYGKEGGTSKTTKPSYRYRGLIEHYTSYIIYLMLSNDTAQGELNNGLGIQMSFPVFHKYWYGEFLQLLVRFDTRYAAYTEISDVVFSSTWFDGGVPGFVPAHAAGIARPAVVIGFMANRVALFYDNIVRPYFSRHLAGLDPLPAPMPVGAAPIPPNLVRVYIMQMYTKKHLMSRQNLDVFLHLCERASPGDIDSFINHVGIRAVVRTWSELLQSAPNKVDRLLGQWVDAWTLYEYSHIKKALNPSSGLLKLPDRVSESIYLMCYTLDDPNEPTNDSDINDLREGPKCSDYKAALRLEMAGAFISEE